MVEKIKNIVVFVRDFQAARRFYKDLLGLPIAQESETMMEFLPGSETKLGVALALHEAAQKLVGRHTGVTLNVTGLDALCTALVEKGAHFTEPLERTPWGKMAVVADPDGNEFALVEG
ncbi:VOC family protein [Geomesophilobacter sediminis]|uniref:VOC family protein n=1 Tax=Geomesophilobacter sediminis TaxID=2798584 RepID=A0A8J7M364_9BACT|nr:glyoxalase superfamily protein [Geomesophilobacter sediminis]MBJ6727905.1 VOC family protein [Geomesophilobacter sediminis]